MTLAMFPQYPEDELAKGMREFRARSDADVFVAEREMGSDALLDNEISHAAHRKAGYTEVDRILQFRKSL